METNNFIPGIKIDFRLELDYIQYSVQKGNVTKLFNLAGFSEENTAELIAVGSHHYVMGGTTDKRKLVIQVLSEKIRISHLVVSKTNHENVFFLPIQPRYKFSANNITVTTQDVSRSGLDALFVQEFNSLHAINDEMSNLRCRMNKIYRKNVLALMGNGDSHSLFIGKEGVTGLHAESAGAIIYVHHCAKK